MVTVVGNILNFVWRQKYGVERGWRKWMPLSVDPLRWLQSMSSRTNVASNTITVHLISSIHLSAFLSSPVWSKLAELSFKIRQHLTIFATRRHLWFHFSLGVPALNCKYPQNGADWLKNMSFLVIPIYWRHSVLTSQWDSKTSECREAVSSANYD